MIGVHSVQAPQGQPTQKKYGIVHGLVSFDLKQFVGRRNIFLFPRILGVVNVNLSLEN
jgi:hypothetical protein